VNNLIGLQHGDIGFYNDILSLFFTLITCLLSMALAVRSNALGIVSHKDHVFAVCTGAAVLCVCSFVNRSSNPFEYQNLLLIINGFILYLAFRQADFGNITIASIATICLVLASITVLKWAAENQLFSVFSNKIFTAGFLAVALPIMVGAALDCGKERMNRAMVYVIVATLSAVLIALMRGRSALIGVGAGLAVMLIPILIVWRRKLGDWRPRGKALSWMLAGSILVGVCAMAVPVARQLYLLKPISGAGRVLIWTVTA
jgi:hypothetical protein